MNKKIILSFFAVLVLIILIVTGLYFYLSQTSGTVQVETEQDIIVDNTPIVVSSTTIYYKTLSFVKNNNNEIVEMIPGTTTNATVGTDPYVLEINKATNSYSDNKTTFYSIIDNGKQYPAGSYYVAGTITNGKFKGKELLVVLKDGEMMGDEYFYAYLLSIGNDQYIEFKNDTDTTFSLKQPNYPETITFPGTEYILKKSSINFATGTTTKSFVVDGIKYLVINNLCVITEMPDGRSLHYDFEYPIINKTSYGLLDFKPNDSKANKETYSYALATCNSYCGMSPSIVSISEQDISTGVYKLIGTAPDNKGVYTYTNPNNEILKAMYEDKNTAAWIDITDAYTNLDQSKYSYEQFLMYYPIIFWQDALGNWIKFSNTRFTTIAEKCKPVIYLYPENDTALNVQVTPNGGFTKTIPEYPAGGWNVLATPQSVIKDLLTNKTYPYLYWSGIGINYPVDYNLGWLVKHEDVSGFLDDKLALLGLNDKEATDFKEYWVPKLSVDEYYQIYFLSKAQIDQMDPLEISPVKPDNVIRVMLTAKGLDKPIDLKAQALPATPKRDGFTVVEWGGVLLK